MSLCDRCHAPGECCRGFGLNLDVEDGEDPDKRLVSYTYGDRRPYPFKVIRDGTEHEYKTRRWSCTALLPSGRCGIYADRPPACRDFRPASDPLCVHFWHEAGDQAFVVELRDYRVGEISAYQELTCPPPDGRALEAADLRNLIGGSP